MKKEYQNRSGEYEKSYGGSSYNKDERSHYTNRNENARPTEAPRRVEPPTPSTPSTQGKKRRPLSQNPFFVWLLVVLVSTAFAWILNDDSLDVDEQTEETIDDPWATDDMDLEEDLQSVTDDANEGSDDGANDVTNDVSEQLESESTADSVSLGQIEIAGSTD